MPNAFNPFPPNPIDRWPPCPPWYAQHEHQTNLFQPTPRHDRRPLFRSHPQNGDCVNIVLVSPPSVALLGLVPRVLPVQGAVSELLYLFTPWARLWPRIWHVTASSWIKNRSTVWTDKICLHYCLPLPSLIVWLGFHTQPPSHRHLIYPWPP